MWSLPGASILTHLHSAWLELWALALATGGTGGTGGRGVTGGTAACHVHGGVGQWEYPTTEWNGWFISQKIPTGWWFQPLWKIWKSIGIMIPIINGKIKDVPNHQPAKPKWMMTGGTAIFGNLHKGIPISRQCDSHGMGWHWHIDEIHTISTKWGLAIQNGMITAQLLEYHGDAMRYTANWEYTGDAMGYKTNHLICWSVRKWPENDMFMTYFNWRIMKEESNLGGSRFQTTREYRPWSLLGRFEGNFWSIPVPKSPEEPWRLVGCSSGHVHI